MFILSIQICCISNGSVYSLIKQSEYIIYFDKVPYVYISRTHDRELPNLIYRQVLFLDFRLIVAVPCNNNKHMAMHATLVIVNAHSPCIPIVLQDSPFLQVACWSTRKAHKTVLYSLVLFPCSNGAFHKLCYS